MLSTAIVIFREALEIAMIVGVLLAATRGLPGRMPWIFGGIAAGVAGAALVACFADGIAAALSGSGQEMFNACILLAAAAMIGWTLVWMKKHARELTAHLRHVGSEVREGNLPFYSLSLIIGLALLREGSEIVLFVYGMVLSDQSVSSIALGCVIGALLGAAAGVGLYYGLLRMAARRMLTVTSWLLMLLVAGLVSQAVGFLSAAGYFTSMSQTIWDTSWLLSESSIPGRAMRTLVGYTSQPSLIQLICYGGTLLILMLMTRHMGQLKAQA